MCQKLKSPIYTLRAAATPRQTTQAIVAITPHARAIIPQTKPPVAIPFFAGSFLEIAPKTIAIIPQIEPIHPRPMAPIPKESTRAIMPKTNDATAMLHPPFVFLSADFTFTESTIIRSSLTVF